MDTLTTMAVDASGAVGTMLARATGVDRMIKDKCVAGLMEAISPDLARYSPLISIMFRMVDQKPAPTGHDVEDQVKWQQYIDKYVNELEEALGKPINEMFDDQFVANFTRFTGEDGRFLQNREAIIELLYESPQFSGLMEGFLKQPVLNFADHSVTLEDRFHKYLPEWILNIAKPGLRLVGDTERQPALNLKSLNVVGIAMYDPVAGRVASELNANPMEQFKGTPEGVDKFGNAYKYRYFGPGNPIPNGDPINALDAIAMHHDIAYAKHGYNTPGAREADRVMVEEMEKAIRSGAISEDSVDDQYKLAKQAKLYFSIVDVK